MKNLEQLVDFSCNQTLRINSLEKKHNANGLSWQLPTNFKCETFPELSLTTGEPLGYLRRIDLATVEDFDGRKSVVRSQFFDQDGQPNRRKEQLGIDRKHPRYKCRTKNFYGYKSKNFRSYKLPLKKVVEALCYGWSVAPGLHDCERDPRGSYRSRLSLVKTRFLFLDGDNWEAVGGPPSSYRNLVDRFPDIEKDFFYLGESVSSRSVFKDYLNLRLGLLLPRIVVNSKKTLKDYDDELFKQIVKYYHEKYPFIDEAVGKDISRQSFGNGRSDVFHKTFDNMMSMDLFNECKQRAVDEKKRRKVEVKKKQELRNHKNAEKYYRKQIVQQLVNRDIIEQPNYDFYESEPLKVFFEEVDPIKEMTRSGVIEPIGENKYRWYESSSFHSLTVWGSKINFWSTTPKQYFPPKAGLNDSINSYRFLIYYQYGYDVDNLSESDRDDLNLILANDGYGKYACAKEVEEFYDKVDRLADEYL